MKSYIESFEYYYTLYPIENIDLNNITFSTNELPWDCYVVKNKHLKYIKDSKEKNNYTNKEKKISRDFPDYNSFKFLDKFEKENLYIDFANLLSPKNKKQKVNKLTNIKNFIEIYGYILPFSSEELEDEFLIKPLSEIENEIKIFNALINIKKILDSDLKIGNHILPIKYYNLIVERFDILKSDGFNYFFDEEIVIKSEEMIFDIVTKLKLSISYVIESIIKNCRLSYSLRNNPPLAIVCNSLLEVMYLQFAEDMGNSNIKIGVCEHCGKYVKLRKNKNYKHIYCTITDEEKTIYNIERSPCEICANMARYRQKQKDSIK